MLPAVLAIHPFLPGAEELADIAIRLLLTLIVAIVVWQLSFLLIGRVERWIARTAAARGQGEQRAHTLAQIFRNLAVVLVFGAAILHALEVFGWNVGPLLAGAGILGVALGFGAQFLVRDVIAGFFILAEDQFAVGDIIVVEGSAATVEAMTLRHTQLRDVNGYVRFVPNGEMKIVTNQSRGWNRVLVDVPIALSEDLEKALAECRSVAATLSADPAWTPRLIEPAQVWGVESLSSPDVLVRLALRGRPGGDAPEAARELRVRLHRALGRAGIRMRSDREIVIRRDPGADHALRGAREAEPGPERPPSDTTQGRAS